MILKDMAGMIAQMNRFCIVYSATGVNCYGRGTINFYGFAALNYTKFPV